MSLTPAQILNNLLASTQQGQDDNYRINALVKSFGDFLPQSVVGFVAQATLAQMQAGTSQNTIVTPYSLASIAISYGTSLSLSGSTLNTIQGIGTTDSPTFNELTLTAVNPALNFTGSAVALNSTAHENQFVLDDGTGNVLLISANTAQVQIFGGVGVQIYTTTGWVGNGGSGNNFGDPTDVWGNVYASAYIAANYGRPAAGQTGAVAKVEQITVGAADSSYLVSANVLVTASTTHNFTVTCTYHDEGNTARVLTLNFSNVGGTIATAIANAGGAVPYEGVPMHIRAKAGTTITIATTGTFTSVTYNVEGVIQQIQ